MKAWLYPGAKVVCVDDAPNRWTQQWLRAGELYVVRWIGDWSDPVRGAGVHIKVEDVQKSETDSPFNVARFRPVLPDTSKQIEAMRSLMLDATVRGKVSA